MYKTIIISDLHLGNPYSNWEILEEFLLKNRCENLFLNGDIIDELYLNRNNKELPKKELKFFNWMINLKNTKVIYIIGNHENFDKKHKFVEEIWDKYNVKIYSDYMYYPTVPDLYSSYYISHGHNTIFKNIITDSPATLRKINSFIRFIGKIKKVQYGIILKKGKINIQKGIEFNILSKTSKKLFKIGLKVISRYRSKIKYYNKRFNANIICGHSHTPEIKSIKKFHYLNSGDWLESNTLLSQKLDGNWEIIKL